MLLRTARPTTGTLRLPSDPSAYTNTPVHRLPNELLVEIFKYCACTHEEPCDPEYDSWSYDAADPAWLAILLVCRHWCDVACATPALWRVIMANSKAPWFELCIARSAGTTVDVLLPWPMEAQSLSDAIRAIVAHASQIRKLVVVVHVQDGFDDLKRIWHTCMPVLEDLTLYILIDSGTAHNVVETHLDPVLFPALRMLRIAGASWSLRSPIAFQLHTLRLSWAEPFPSWSDEETLKALGAIAQHGALRHLELSHAYFPWERPTRTYPIPLLHLDSLILVRWDTEGINQMLPHFQLGLNTDVSLTVDTTQQCLWDGSQLHGLLSLIPLETEGLPILHNTSSVSVRFYDTGEDRPERNLEIICKSRVGRGRGKLTIKFVAVPNRINNLEWQYALDDALQDFCKLFVASPLTKLSMHEFGTSSKQRASATALAHVFRTFPALAVVEAEYNHPQSSCEELLKALSASKVRDTVHEPGTPESPTPAQAQPKEVVLPRLRVLRITQLPWREHVLPSLVLCMRRRAAGGTRLGDLHVELYDRPGGFEGEGSQVHHNLLRGLRSWSTRVTYLDGEAAKAPRRS